MANQRFFTRSTVARTVAGLFCAFAFVGTASAKPYDEMIIFGDSLSDRGNCFGATAGTAPKAPGYSDKRFTNGPLWAERLSQAIGLGAVKQSLSVDNPGNDFAYGGVTTGAGVTIYNPGGFIEVGGPNIGRQVTDWTADHDANANQLFTMLGGGNDFFAVLDSGATTTPATVAGNMKTNLTNLYNDGARNLLVLNLPDLGQVPRYRGTGRQAQATQLTTDYNAALKTALDDLDATKAGIHIYRVDLYKLIADAIAKPGDFGFTNVTDRAYTGDDTFAGNGTPVADPSKYLFWDAVHPTAAAHSRIGDAAFSALPEPGVGISVVVAALGLIGRRSRRAA